jgi:hypothetical protein
MVTLDERFVLIKSTLTPSPPLFLTEVSVPRQEQYTEKTKYMERYAR